MVIPPETSHGKGSSECDGSVINRNDAEGDPEERVCSVELQTHAACSGISIFIGRAGGALSIRPHLAVAIESLNPHVIPLKSNEIGAAI